MFRSMQCGRKRLPLCVLPVLGLALGCSDDPVLPDANSRVAGRVDGPGGYGTASVAGGPAAVEGASVVLVRIEIDGSTEIISLAPDTTGAQGMFLLETEAVGRGDYMVVATTDDAVWRALVSAELESGAEVPCPPLNSETTAEAGVYMMLGADPEGSIRADIATGINGDLGIQAAEQVDVRTSLAAAFAFATSVTTGALDRAEMSGLLDVVAENRLAALAVFEADLLQASTQAEVEAAVEAHLDADVSAMEESGVPPETQAWARNAAAVALVKAGGSLAAGARLELERRAGDVRVRVDARAMQEIFARIDASASVRASLTGAKLSALAAVDGASSGAEIGAALDAYAAAVLQQLEIAMGTRAAAVAAAQVAVNATGGPVLALESDLGAAATGEAWVDAFADYFSAVRAVVSVSLTGATEGETDAVAETLMLVNIPS